MNWLITHDIFQLISNSGCLKKSSWIRYFGILSPHYRSSPPNKKSVPQYSKPPELKQPCLTCQHLRLLFLRFSSEKIEVQCDAWSGVFLANSHCTVKPISSVTVRILPPSAYSVWNFPDIICPLTRLSILGKSPQNRLALAA